MSQNEFWIETTDKYRLHARVWGNPELPALVLVHGYPDNQEIWEHMLPYLVDTFFVITYDVRGAGQSDVPSTVQSYCLPQLADDLEAVVSQIIPKRRFHLAAHDWGSIQSWEAVTEPRFKGKIISFSTISGPCLDHARVLLKKLAKTEPLHFVKIVAKSWYIGVFHLPLVAPTLWKLNSEKRWQAFLSQLEGKGKLPINEQVLKDGENGVKLYRANFIPSLGKSRQRYAQCPVQAIVLNKDQFVSAEYSVEMANWVEDFSRVEVDANHWAILSQPEIIAQHIVSFALAKNATA